MAEAYMVILLDYCSSIMPPNVDTFIMIYELSDTGYANLYLEIAKRIIAVSQTQFVTRVFRIYVVNSSFTTRMIYGSVKPFLHERARQKV